MQSIADVRALRQSAAEALHRGDASFAREAFEKIAAVPGADVSVWLGLGIARDMMGDHEAAGAALDKAIELDPRNLRALILRADIFEKAGDTRAASSYYQAALQAAAPGSQLPPDIAAGLQRAQAMTRKYTADYETHLRGWFAARGIDAEHASGRFGRSLDLMFGKRQIYLQEPLYYYFPELPQIQFYERKNFPWLDRVEAATGDIRNELLDVMKEDGAFAPYVEAEPNRRRGNYRGMLGNPEWSAFYLWKNGKPVEKNAARCPRTLEALKDAPLARVKGRTPTVLFSLLKAGARIPPHHGFINTRLICHLPLIVPEGCSFRVGNDTRDWQEGKAWVFDDTIEHEAWNGSDRTRVILLFDIWRPELDEAERETVSSLFEAIDAYGGKPAEWNV